MLIHVFQILHSARRKNPKSHIINFLGVTIETGGFTRKYSKSCFFTKEEVDAFAEFNPSSPNNTVRHEYVCGVGRYSLNDKLVVNNMEELFNVVWRMIQFCNTPLNCASIGFPWTSAELENAWESLSGRKFIWQ